VAKLTSGQESFCSDLLCPRPPTTCPGSKPTRKCYSGLNQAIVGGSGGGGLLSWFWATSTLVRKIVVKMGPDMTVVGTWSAHSLRTTETVDDRVNILNGKVCKLFGISCSVTGDCLVINWLRHVRWFSKTAASRASETSPTYPTSHGA
jgi:hypothetical protein